MPPKKPPKRQFKPILKHRKPPKLTPKQIEELKKQREQREKKLAEEARAAKEAERLAEEEALRPEYCPDQNWSKKRDVTWCNFCRRNCRIILERHIPPEHKVKYSEATRPCKKCKKGRWLTVSVCRACKHG